MSTFRPALSFFLAPGLLATALLLSAAPLHAASAPDPAQSIVAHHSDGPLIQVALLLDDSGSMSGLINQARAQLWELVGLLGKTTRDGKRPRIEVALYHYGDTPFLAAPLIAFTGDLDQISERLFTINGGGGTEACGQVIHQAMTQLAWHRGSATLRLIVIAGNEPFTQGDHPWTSAVAEARSAGVVVHTIHCGPRADGVAGKWEEGAKLGGGTFTCIDQNASVCVAAPQDPDLCALNLKLNATYLAYGAEGLARLECQKAQDSNAAAVGGGAQRTAAKASAAYGNASWDLVDAVKEKKVDLAAASGSELPAELRDKTPAEREAVVAAKTRERAELQTRIAQLSVEREAWLRTQQPTAATLGDGLRAAIAAQAVAAGFAIAP